jgi:hypothetical protein
MTNYVDLDSLSATTLRHLAALREDRDRQRLRDRYIDYESMAEEVAIMLSVGDRPTLGFYRRRLRQPEPAEASEVTQKDVQSGIFPAPLPSGST